MVGFENCSIYLANSNITPDYRTSADNGGRPFSVPTNLLIILSNLAVSTGHVLVGDSTASAKTATLAQAYSPNSATFRPRRSILDSE